MDVRTGYGGLERAPVCGAIVKATGLSCQCPGFFNGKCGRHRSDKPIRRPILFTPFECSICMEMCSQTKDSYTTSCKHKFHERCLVKWVKSSFFAMPCPLCRHSLRSQILGNPPPAFNVPPPPPFTPPRTPPRTLPGTYWPQTTEARDLLRTSIHLRLQLALSAPPSRMAEHRIRDILEEVRLFEASA